MNIIKKIFQKSRSLEDGIFFDTLQKILGNLDIHIDGKIAIIAAECEFY